MIREYHDEQGVILIALLWVLVALSIIGLSFSRESYVEVAAARNTRDLADAYYVARAGIHTTIYRLLEKRYIPKVQGIDLGETDPLDLGEVQGEFGGGSYKVEIQDESGKINVNIVNEDQLRSLLEVLEIKRPDLDIIADSIMDWRDVDTAHRINGAEDDYYQSLARPYKAKNGRIDVVEELLMVRGVTRGYFYGHREKSPSGAPVYRYGLSRYFTVFSNNSAVNINYAEPAVLMSAPGMTPHMAQLIYERRKQKPFRNLGEVSQDLAITLSAATIPFLGTEPSNIYTLTASAHMENSKVQRVIRAAVSLDPRSKTWSKIIYWNENVPNL